jgi:hypothetical protein
LIAREATLSELVASRWRKRLAGHEGVGLEEDRRPADADGSGVSGGGDRVEPHQSIDGKEGDIKREDCDVVHTAAAGGERRGGDGWCLLAHESLA